MRLSECLCALLVLASCSVKEDRTGCPCHLLVMSEEDGLKGVRAYIFDISEKLGELQLETSAGGMECLVPRKNLRVTYMKRPGIQPGNDDMYTIPLGSECDSLFAFSHEIDCSGETAVDTMRLHKNFTSLLGVFVGGNFGIRAVVTGNVCGVSIPELELVGGAFRFEPVVDSKGRFQIRLPRQSDTELKMDIFGSDGNLLWTCPLGQEIISLGYDWSASSLADIALAIDASKFEISLEILPWNEMEPSEETI